MFLHSKCFIEGILTSDGFAGEVKSPGFAQLNSADWESALSTRLRP
jgi:hypothetical protein